MPCWSRRRTLKNAGIAGAAMAASACSSGATEDVREMIDLSDYPPLPDDLPTYAYGGSPGPETMFSHGVASGDPLADAVILWTRVSPASEGPVEVFWEMALDDAFNYRVAAGSVVTGPERDYTVKHDAQGLIWGRKYYYRFHALGRTSPVGRTKLAPAGGDGTEALRIAVCSCSNYAYAYFHAYRWMAGRRDLDLVLHLGDYIYEYGEGDYGSPRALDPEHEIVTLKDYRRRYAQYRSDTDLQESISGTRSSASGMTTRPPTTPTRTGPRTTMKARASGPIGSPPRCRHGLNGCLSASQRRPPRVGSIARCATATWPTSTCSTRGSSAVTSRMRAPRLRPTRRGSSSAKRRKPWLAGELAGGKGRWQLVGQQVMLGQWFLFPNGDAWDGYKGARARFFDIWEANAPAASNLVVLTGDIHMSFAQELGRDPLARELGPRVG